MEIQWFPQRYSNSTIGSTSLHELSESYEGGLLSLENGVSSPRANQKESVYKDAHSLAYPQPPVYERAVSQQGLLLSPKIVSDNVFYMLPAGKIINFVRNKNGKETVIQVYP